MFGGFVFRLLKFTVLLRGINNYLFANGIRFKNVLILMVDCNFHTALAHKVTIRVCLNELLSQLLSFWEFEKFYLVTPLTQKLRHILHTES
jgi:hypothetical protein